MKKLSLLIITLSISGCSYLSDVWHGTRYDANEYAGIVNIRQTISQKERCDNDQVNFVNTLKQQVDWENTYSSGLPHNTEVVKMLGILQTEVNSFVVKSKENNSFYCNLKLSSLDEQTKLIQKTMGEK
jgi:hypothetical protein